MAQESPARGASSRDLQLRAGHVEIEGPFNRLSLSEGVELKVHRYWVTAQCMTLQRSARGLQVDGAGKLAFCPCSKPPLTFGFSSALVAPPTDLILKNVSFRAFGVPFFWLPYYWVRSPNRLGVMTPRFSYRGRDGAFIGTAVHVPLSTRVEPSPEFLDVSVGSYLLSGVDLGAQLVTVNTLTNVRWDYLRSGIVELDIRGHRALDEASSVSWRVDAIRGRRAKTGYVEPDAAIRAYDQSRGEIIIGDGRSLVSLGVVSSTLRGTPLREVGLWGPSARLGIGTPIGELGHVDSSTIAYALATQGRETNALAVHSSTLRFDARPGPVSLRVAEHQHFLLGSGDLGNQSSALVGADVASGLPLVRSFGTGVNRFSHWVEPQFIATSAYQRASSGYPQFADGSISTLQAGLLNLVGRTRSTWTTSLMVRAGVSSTVDANHRAVAAKWLSSGSWLALGGVAAVEATPHESGHAWMSSLRGRLGRADRLALATRLEGRSSSEPVSARWLIDEGFVPWHARWYSVSGWTWGGDLASGVFEQLAVSVGSTVDLQKQAPIAHRASAAYRHSCGCLAISSLAGWRVGRPGVDVSVLVDLMP